jgi:hypothetical protein
MKTTADSNSAHGYDALRRTKLNNRVTSTKIERAIIEAKRECEELNTMQDYALFLIDHSAYWRRMGYHEITRQLKDYYSKQG